MQRMKHNFLALELCGLWQPVNWSPGKKTKLYGVYTSFVMFVLVTVIVSQFMELLNSINDIDGFANNTFISLIIVADCGKAINVLIKRDDIVELTSSLRRDPCRPKNDEEIAIQRKFDRMIRFNTLRYCAVVWGTVTVALLSSVIVDIPRRTLPYETWMPFDYKKSLLSYSFVYVHQILGIVFGAAIGYAFDTLLPALMLQTCAQLNILMHRFDKMPDDLLEIVGQCKNEDRTIAFVTNAESVLLSERVQHHLAIFEFAQKSNDLFGITIFMQCAISVPVLCMGMLRLSKERVFSPAFTELSVYLTEMSIQILLFCFYGGEVIIESLKVGDAIYEMDWPSLSVRARRSLLTIMARTLRPIKFTTAHIITLNLESFRNLVKLSYSTYNVL